MNISKFMTFIILKQKMFTKEVRWIEMIKWTFFFSAMNYRMDIDTTC